MAIHFPCQCGAKLKAADDKAGKTFDCPTCGRSVTVPQPASEFIHSIAVDDRPEPPPKAPAAFHCPVCGSEQIQRVSVIVNAGTIDSTGRTGSTGVIVGDGLDIVPVFATSKTRSQQKTQLAQRLAPPKPPDVLRDDFGCAAVILIFIALLVVWMLSPGIRDTQSAVITMVSAAVFVTGAVVVARKLIPPVTQKRMDAHAAAVSAHFAAMDEWNGRFFCHRCGKVFTPAEPAAP